MSQDNYPSRYSIIDQHEITISAQSKKREKTIAYRVSRTRELQSYSAGAFPLRSASERCQAAIYNIHKSLRLYQYSKP